MNNLFADENLIKVLKNGGVAVLPTDTLYGVLGSALNKRTVERIYDIRKRNPEKPCIILIGDITDLEKFSVSLIPEEKKILRGYWEGGSEGPNDKRSAVSVVLPCNDSALQYLHRGTNTLAFRVPTVENLRYLLKNTGPLIAPSANIEGLEPAHDIKEAKKYFGDLVDIYIDGGRVSGNASKVIKLENNGQVVVLRP